MAFGGREIIRGIIPSADSRNVRLEMESCMQRDVSVNATYVTFWKATYETPLG